jgi:hypothetical protein
MSTAAQRYFTRCVLRRLCLQLIDGDACEPRFSKCRSATRTHDRGRSGAHEPSKRRPLVRAPLSTLDFRRVNAHDHRYGASLIRNALDDQPRLLAYGERQERFC